jgi:hypothetical protein
MDQISRMLASRYALGHRCAGQLDPQRRPAHPPAVLILEANPR